MVSEAIRAIRVTQTIVRPILIIKQLLSILYEIIPFAFRVNQWQFKLNKFKPSTSIFTNGNKSPSLGLSLFCRQYNFIVFPSNIFLAETLALSTLKAVMEEKVTSTNVEIACVAPKYKLYTVEQVEAVLARL